jgi:hypothetical protein
MEHTEKSTKKESMTSSPVWDDGTRTLPSPASPPVLFEKKGFFMGCLNPTD